MRKTAGLFLILCLLARLAPALEREPAEVFAGRRARLMKSLPNGVTVLFGYTAAEGESLRNPFRQQSDFYYLTGWNEPGAILMLIPPPSERNSPAYSEVSQMPREILFLPARDSVEERWTGVKSGPYDEGVREKAGFQVVLGTEIFEKELASAVTGFGRIYTLKPRPHAADREPVPSRYQTLEKITPLAEIGDAAQAIAALRMVKSPGEIALIQKATDATVAAHLAAWRRARPGLYEYQVAATMLSILFDRGCERTAYSPIVGAGINSTILHYPENSARMDSGQVLLMDVGGEYSMYATDITRTIPVGGKFSPRQRELYDVVLGAQKAVLAAIKPGMTLGRSGGNSLHQIAFQYINTHGKDREGNPLGKYFIHGIGHHVGLEVHDPSTPGAELAPGMVITVEPGVYIPEEKIGIRIEDIVLVTDTGAKVLSAALPREAEEIERLMR
ncbi:MAG TPA: Xaa-Pro peptidase family protein [Bryobacterales bacterium]|jgi:Xaa-Pro aminopeptidase|nr:Xaa-Pro peptidase family protein [Bryobacterales bacterium]